MNTAVFLFLVFNLVFFAAVAYYFLKLKSGLSDERRLELEEEKVHEDEVMHDESRIQGELDNAHKRSLAILSESEKIANELILELEKVIGRKDTDISYIRPGENFEIELGRLSEKIHSHYIERIKKLLKSVENFEIDQAQKVLSYSEEQQAITDKNLQQMRLEELEKIHQRIERYKEEELSLFDKKVKAVIDKAAVEVLGKALTSQEQESLIEEALEKAKKEGII